MYLYCDNGYLNVPEVDLFCDINKINFVIIIGGRQVGKTFGTLKMMIEKKRPFILMRRTQTETDFIMSGNSPFTGIDNAVKIKRDTKYTAKITKDDRHIGEIMALSTVSKIRGFDGTVYSDLIFDEFIPEVHVNKMKNEGDAFLNAVITISGAREEKGEKPLRVWLLANSNNIANPILDSLGVIDDIEKIIKRDKEYICLKDRGVLIIMPNSELIMNKRKNNAIFRAAGTDSKFAKMALGNVFSYNDAENVSYRNLAEYVPCLKIGYMYIYKHKHKPEIYSTDKLYGTVPPECIFDDTEENRKFVRFKFPDIKIYNANKLVKFSSIKIKNFFIDIFG